VQTIHKLREKTSVFFKRALISSAVVSALSLLAGAWPFLRVQGAYIMSITQTLSAWTGLKSIQALPRTSKRDSVSDDAPYQPQAKVSVTKAPRDHRTLSLQVQQEVAAMEGTSSSGSGVLANFPEEATSIVLTEMKPSTQSDVVP